MSGIETPIGENPHGPDPISDWEEGEARLEAGPGDRLVVDVEGFEGPLDLLLALARTQKVDLAKISVLALAQQYLDFIAEARRLRLEVASAAPRLESLAAERFARARSALHDPRPFDVAEAMALVTEAAGTSVASLGADPTVRA